MGDGEDQQTTHFNQIRIHAAVDVRCYQIEARFSFVCNVRLQRMKGRRTAAAHGRSVGAHRIKGPLRLLLPARRRRALLRKLGAAETVASEGVERLKPVAGGHAVPPGEAELSLSHGCGFGVEAGV